MLIKNGFLIDPATKKSGNYDIRIENGIITEIGNTLSPAPNEQVTDAAGLTVAPGLIDTHIHFRDPGFTYKEKSEGIVDNEAKALYEEFYKQLPLK